MSTRLPILIATLLAVAIVCLVVEAFTGNQYVGIVGIVAVVSAFVVRWRWKRSAGQ
jgi:membrane-bound ClpP family serine protease